MFCFNATTVLEHSILRTSNGVQASSRLCVLHFDPGFISSPCYTLVPYSAQTPDGRKVFESVSLLCRSPPARGSQTLVPSVEKVFNAVLSQEHQVMCVVCVVCCVLSQEQQVQLVRRQLVAGGGRANMWSVEHNDQHGLAHQ